MRLAKLVMTGYRSVKGQQTLVTDDRVTILIGANDHGKSNLLAALQCLNDDKPIEADDRNWDSSLAAPVEIKWHFLAGEPVLQRLRKLGPVTPTKPVETPANTAELIAGEDVTAAVADGDKPVADKIEAKPIEIERPAPTYPVNDKGEIVFVRNISENAVRIVSLPVPVLLSHEQAVLSLRPRVELFESPSGNVVDHVDRSRLEKPEYEFMQGIFRLAGLWDVRDEIFTQNDMTSRKLNEASDALTKILNDRWNQGKELKWRFEHTGTNGDNIVIKIEDPAIKGRYTRPSLRSSGFRTYFLLSMIVYARTENTASDSHIYLFDEPGTYLHPAAQLDLQRSFESIADQAQIVYTTHSLFLVSKNYPARNRVISKTVDGTKIDQKPFSKNWKSVRESLGILFSNNFLIADKTLLVEGPSDTVYFLSAVKKLKASKAIDIDLNDISIVDAGDAQNYVAMAKIMLSEGRNLVALVDGDGGGKKLATSLEKSCQAELSSKKLQIHLLPNNKSSEDVFADLTKLKAATRNAFDKLIADGSRISKDGLDIEHELNGIELSEASTLGKTLEKVTKALFKPEEKISKLLIAVLYEDEDEEASPPGEALPQLNAIKELLGLRREKSQQSGVFEEV